jgi:hypothetical protein
MRRFHATAALWATLVLIALSGFKASSAGATDTPDNEEQPIPPMTERNGVIPPPPTGDEDIL